MNSLARQVSGTAVVAVIVVKASLVVVRHFYGQLRDPQLKFLGVNEVGGDE